VISAVGYIGGALLILSWCLHGKLMLIAQCAACIVLIVYSVMMSDMVFVVIQAGCLILVVRKIISKNI